MPSSLNSSQTHVFSNFRVTSDCGDISLLGSFYVEWSRVRLKQKVLRRTQTLTPCCEVGLGV